MIRTPKKIEVPKRKAFKKKEIKKTSFLDGLFLGGVKDYIMENLALTVDSGMGILPSLESLSEGTDSKRSKKIIDQIKLDVEEGCALWDALDRSGLFAERAISLIKIGEESGRLVANLRVAAEQLQKEKSFNSKIKGALMYPVFVMVVAVVVGLGVAWFILPKLATIFSQLNTKLPFITVVFLSVGVFLGKYGAVAVPAFIVIFLAIIYFIFFFKKTRFLGRYLVFRAPIFKNIVKQMEIARFGQVTGNLLRVGMPIVETIGSLKESSAFYDYRKFYTFLEVKVSEGASFQQSFMSYKGMNKLLPSPVQQMIMAAEKSGHLSEALIKVGNIYEEKLDNTTKNLAIILEPVLLVVVWIGVMMVALAVILPVYGLIGGIQQP